MASVQDGIHDTSHSGPCPLCGQNHDDFYLHFFKDDLNRIPSRELVDLRDYYKLERAQARAEGRGNTEMGKIQLHRLRCVEIELARRRKLRLFGGPNIPVNGYFKPEFITELKRRVSISEVAFWIRFRYPPQLQNARRARFRCPAHGDGTDRDPSGVLYLEENRWHCFGCNRGGDIFDLLLAYKIVGSFREAVEYVALNAGYELPQKGNGNASR